MTRTMEGAHAIGEIPPDAGPTIMWEARAADGQAAALLAWAVEHAPPDADVYRSVDGRVVVIDPTGTGLAEAPAELLARSPHAWRFERVPR